MSNDSSGKLSVIFFGTPDFAVPTLQALFSMPNTEVRCVVTQPDRPAGRGKELRPSPIKVQAAKKGVPIIQPESIKRIKSAFIQQLNQYAPFDIGVVIAFGQILPEVVLNLPRYGSVNLHASLLPRWRGAAPIQRALIHGDTETGVCLMRMEPALDSGPVFSSEKCAISKEDSFGSLHDKLAQISASLIKQDLEKICRGELVSKPQGDGGVAYANKILEQEAHIDWSKSANELHNLIRGLSPIPGAFTTVQGKRLKILKAALKKPFSGQSFQPGQVQAIDKNMLEIKCGADALALLEVQLEGKQRMPIGVFLNGYSIKSGIRLGE